MIGTTTALIIGGAIAAGGSVAGAKIASGAASKAADAQTEGANYAADLQYKAQQDALALQQQQWNQTQANYAPWLVAGQTGLTSLLQRMGLGTLAPTTTTVPGAADPYAEQRTQIQSQLSGIDSQIAQMQQALQNPNISYMDGIQLQQQLEGLNQQRSTIANSMAELPPVPQGTSQTTWGVTPTASGTAGTGDLMQPWTKEFQAPTLSETNDPGYAFRLAEGQKAIERSAAAKGNALSGAGLKAALRFGQDYASNEYGRVYDRAKDEYNTAFNVFQTNQANAYNRLANLAGLGQTTANQLSNAGQQYAGNAGNIYLNTANNVGQLQQNAANARASGYINSANAWNSAIGGITNNFNEILMNQLLRNPTSPASWPSANGIPVPYNPNLGPYGWGS